MPAIGTRHRSDNNYLITTKVYGPTLTFMFDPKDLLKEVKNIADAEDAPGPKQLASTIAHRVADLVLHDVNATWVDCEVLGSDGVLYYDVVEFKEEE